MIFKSNRLNLLCEVRSGDTLQARYTYLSDGTKLGVRDGSGRNGYDYLGSFVYKVSAVWHQGILNRPLFDNASYEKDRRAQRFFLNRSFKPVQGIFHINYKNREKK